jgi:hypothetical protein
MAGDGLWAITSYFNPVGYRSRLENYRIFHRRLQAPLVAVELSFDGRFELAPGDATVLVQVRGGDVMWQKERLLNLALESVPPACDRIAWIDCDVVFGSPGWAAAASRALDELALVHLYETRHDLLAPSNGHEPGAARSRRAESVVFRMSKGEATNEDLSHANAPQLRGSSAGLAWAGRRDVLERHGFYDACILGTGDRVMLCAALGRFDLALAATFMNTARAAHYLAWAEPYFATVNARVGCIPGSIYHLWHGDIADRRYADRQRLLADFDPSTDIALDESRCWRWSTNKPWLHECVRRYFELREEDRPAATGARPGAHP